MEFKKLETEAAFMLMNELRNEAAECASFSNKIDAELESNPNRTAEAVDRQKVISINLSMKAEIYKKAVEQLQQDITEQKFDY